MRSSVRGFAVMVAAFTLTLSAFPAASAAPGPFRHAATSTAAATAMHQHRTARACTTTRSGHAACHAIKQTDTVQPAALTRGAVAPNATPTGLGPADLRSAYNLSATGSSAITVAIVDAYDDPTAESDLAAYRTQYGLPACTSANGCFKKVNQNGTTSPLPTADTGWASEISLDIQMVSAICPRCRILLVEATTSFDVDLYAAEDAAYAAGAKFISNSWGGDESPSQTDADTHFNHPGVAITVSTGDNGYGVQYPAASKYVTAVGGTTLSRSSTTRGWSETAWYGAGSGCSAYDSKPTAQIGVTTNCTTRAVADVAAVADPNTGVAVYQTYGGSGWTVYGGTSVAAPIIASIYALAGAPGTADLASAYPYAHKASLWDVSSGNNGTCSPARLCTSGTGWDGPTGLGSPNGLAAFTAPKPIVTVTKPGSRTATVGTPFSLTLSASGGSSYTWSAAGLRGGLSIESTSGTISGIPTTAGSYSVTATATSRSSSGKTTFTITVGDTTKGGGATQLLGNPGFETGTPGPWTASAGVVSSTTAGEAARTGAYDAWLGGYGTAHTDSLSQSVIIPAAGTASTFTFWLKIDTTETGPTANDVLTVTIGNKVLATYSNLNHGSYALKSFNVGAYAGQTVTVGFFATENNSLQTSFVVDDTALTTN